MKGRVFCVSIGMLLMLSVLLVGACAKQAPVPSPSPSPTASPVASPKASPSAPKAGPTPEKPLVLRYADDAVPGSGRVLGLEWMFDQIKKRTGGRVVVEPYWGGALLKSTETLRGLKDRVADFAIITSGYFIEEIPLTNFISVERFFWGDESLHYHNIHRVVKNFKPIQDELASWNVKFISQTSYTTSGMAAKKPIRTIDDMKGLKSRIPSKAEGALWEPLGITGVFIPFGEVYTALQRGTVDSAMVNLDQFNRYKLYEYAKYFVDVKAMSANLTIYGMNMDVWNGIPENLQQIISQIGEEQITLYLDGMMIPELTTLKKLLKEKNVEVTDLPPAELERLRNSPGLKAYADEYFAKADKKGIPARQAVELFKGGGY